MGGGLSTAITRDLEGITLSTRTTAGSTTNMRMLSREGGGLNLGLANLGAVYNAVTSTGKFKGKPPAKNVRAVMALTISPIHWVTLAKDNIKSFADLKGKRVSLAKAGSGTAANADLILRTVGVRDQIKAQFLGFSEAGNALRDGQHRCLRRRVRRSRSGGQRDGGDPQDSPDPACAERAQGGARQEPGLRTLCHQGRGLRRRGGRRRAVLRRAVDDHGAGQRAGRGRSIAWSNTSSPTRPTST